MTREEKVAKVKFLSEEFSSSSAFIVCDYRGLNVVKFEELRNKVKAIGSKVQVIKNTLASIAMSNAKYSDAELKDTNVFIWGEDQVSLSKVVCGFAGSNELSVKFGFFDHQLVSAEHIEAISKLPSREELIGMLLSVWVAPARCFVTGIENLRKQKESL